MPACCSTDPEHSVDQFRYFRTRRVVPADGPQVGVVDPAVTDEIARGVGGEVVVRPLDETADVVVDLACEKYAGAREHQVVVARVDRNDVARVGIGGVVVLRIRDRSLRHHRERKEVEAFRSDRRLADRVARQLEVTAVGSELGEAHVAGDAFLPCLARE